MNIRLPLFIILAFATYSLSIQPKNKEIKRTSENSKKLSGAVLFIDTNLQPKGCCAVRRHGNEWVPGCANFLCKECYESKSLEYTKAYKKLCNYHWQYAIKKNLLDEELKTLCDIYKKGQMASDSYRDKYNELRIGINTFDGKHCKSWSDFGFHDIEEKLRVITKGIAKNMSASALGLISSHLYVDPEYDITKQAIDQLNNDYLNRS